MKLYRIADQLIEYHFIDPKTAEYFARYETEPLTGKNEILSISTAREYVEESARKRQMPIRYFPGAEYDALALATSAALLSHRKVLFHSVSFTYKNKAIVFTGPSGIGKTTQYAQWKRLLRDEVKVISGDMSGIEARDDGDIWVHPSAWNGKEQLHHEHSAPLAGIVVLKQASENTIRKLEPRDAILPAYSQMCVDRRQKEQIRLALALEDRILRQVPVWELSSLGDLDSARLCHDTIVGEIYGE